MTGTGLVKFERFTAINKLPWDDVNDQFVIQVKDNIIMSVSLNIDSGAWCVRRVRVGDPSRRHPERQDRQQHAGARDIQRGLQGGAGGLLGTQLCLQRGTATGETLSSCLRYNAHPRLTMMKMLRTQSLWKFMLIMRNRLWIKMFLSLCTRLVKVRVEND